MGKAKKRIIANGKYDRISNLTRDEAILNVVKCIKNGEDPTELISLFGLKGEELLEAGADYESIKSLGELL